MFYAHTCYVTEIFQEHSILFKACVYSFQCLTLIWIGHFYFSRKYNLSGAEDGTLWTEHIMEDKDNQRPEGSQRKQDFL